MQATGELHNRVSLCRSAVGRNARKEYYVLMARSLVIAAVILSYGIAKAQTSTCSTLITAPSPGSWWSCVFPAFCSADYDAFPQRAKKYRCPISDTQLTNQLIAMWAGQVTILKT